MNAIRKILSALVLLAMLLSQAAFAQENTLKLYAPLDSEYGPIYIRKVDTIPTGEDLFTVVTLSLPVAYLSALSDFYGDLVDAFKIADQAGLVIAESVGMGGEEGGGYVNVILTYYLPPDSDISTYYLVYGDQMRTLAASDEQPETAAEEPAMEDAEQADTAEDDSFTLNAVLDALGEPLYRATYDSLAQGNVIQAEDSSDDVKGLQTLLRAFGYDVKVSGKAGTKTMGFLRELQAAFGLETADSLGIDGFSLLLTCLLIRNDPDTADELLSEELTYSEFSYLQGLCARQAGRYFQAYSYFLESSEEDAYDKAQACVQQWPDNGKVYHNDAYTGSATKLYITIESQDEGFASYVKIFAENGDLIYGLFVGGSGTVAAKLPAGTYTVRIGTGETWYGPLDAFGDEGYYETLLFDGGAEQVTLKSGYEYTLTINTSTSDPEASGVGSEYTDYGGF